MEKKKEEKKLTSVKKTKEQKGKEKNITKVKKTTTKEKPKKETKVNVILYKDFNVNYYNIAISKHPYTALCVDIFNSDEEKNGLTINSYINKDGLNGKYLIYLEIDGVVYDTEQSVLF